MNEEARKYIDDLREKFKGECDGPGELKRRQELLTTARHATTIYCEDFTKVEMENAAFAVNGSFEFGFYVGARWADEHPKSPWISVKDRLPQLGHSVLVALPDGTCSTGSLHDYSEVNYWNIDHSGDLTEVEDSDYWMPLPELPKGGGR